MARVQLERVSRTRRKGEASRPIDLGLDRRARRVDVDLDVDRLSSRQLAEGLSRADQRNETRSLVMRLCERERRGGEERG